MNEPSSTLIDGSIPGPQRTLASTWRFYSAPLEFSAELVETYGDIARFKLANIPVVMINRPAYIRQVLIDRAGNYDRDTVTYRMARGLFGNGLAVQVGGQEWLRQRRVLQPVFHHKRITGVVEYVGDTVQRHLANWMGAARGNVPLDIGREMDQLTLRIVARVLFSLDPVGLLADAFTAAVATANRELARFVRFPLVPLAVPTPGHRRFHASLRKIDDILFHLIDERRARGDNNNDLLSMLLAAEDETGDPADPQSIRDQAFNMLFAGHETSAGTLTWLWYLLSRHPEIERQLHDEADEVLQGRPPEADDLPKLTFTRAVIDETLRLYPAGWQQYRNTRADDEIDGHRIPAGTTVFWSPYQVHRHPWFWPSPERFDPSRFLPGNGHQHERCAYLPFGDGGHLCIGRPLALLQMTMIVATVAQRFRLVRDGTEVLEPVPLITLSTKPKLRMRIVPR